MSTRDEELPIVIGPFIVPRSKLDGHEIHLHVEGEAGRGRCEGRDVIRPWLRAACSCGWVSEHAFSIEDNAFDQWAMHAHRMDTAATMEDDDS